MPLDAPHSLRSPPRSCPSGRGRSTAPPPLVTASQCWHDPGRYSCEEAQRFRRINHVPSSLWKLWEKSITGCHLANCGGFSYASSKALVLLVWITSWGTRVLTTNEGRWRLLSCIGVSKRNIACLQQTDKMDGRPEGLPLQKGNAVEQV